MSEMRPIRSYPVPANEHARCGVLDTLDLGARRSDPFFDHVTALARRIMGKPIAFLSLISREDQTFLAIDGYDLDGTPRELSLCAFTVAKKKTIVIPDTTLDARSARHPIVVNAPHLRFSASAPIILSSGFCMGTLCVVDVAPGDMPSDDEVAQLEHLAGMVARFYELPAEPDPVQAARLRDIGQEAQDEFLSLVSHELRTPLNGILGLADLIVPADAEQVELLEALVASGRHLNDVVDSILAFTDLRSGDMTPKEGVVDLGQIVAGVLRTFEKLAQISGKTLHVALVAEAPIIRGDAARLELALACLLSNFIAHGGPSGAISVLRQANGELDIDVSDDGHGIAPDRQAAVWRAFAVGAKPSERAADGIGLGLPLANRIVEMHGGELDLIIGEGAMSARIRIPVYRNVEALGPCRPTRDAKMLAPRPSERRKGKAVPID